MPPDISEICKNWAEMVAILIGGGWVLWLFAYEARAHAPSLDGDLTIESAAPSKDLTAASVRATWNNRGKFPVKLKHEDCFVYVFIITGDLPQGSLVFADDQNFKKRQLFDGDLTLEQGSQSILRVHFILQKGPVYLFRWKLKSHKFLEWNWLKIRRIEAEWTKEIIWDSSTVAR